MADVRPREAWKGAYIAIIAAAIGSFGSLIGVVVASSNARHNIERQLSDAHEVRQADLRREVYEGFASAAGKYLIDLEFTVTADVQAELDTLTTRLSSGTLDPSTDAGGTVINEADKDIRESLRIFVQAGHDELS